MKKRFTIQSTITVLFIFIGVSSSLSQSLYNDFIHYSTRNGLSQNDVRSIYQDSYGYIWIGTHDGLNRFDGYDFKTFNTDIYGGNSISSNLISDITEDSRGNIWLGTDDNGISMYNREKGLFHIINNDDNIRGKRLSSNRIGKILIDQNGTIWAGSDEGLNKITYDYDQDTYLVSNFYHEEAQPESISQNFITSLFEDRLGNIWIGTKQGLNRYVSNKQGQDLFFKHLSDHGITDVQETEKGLLVCAGQLYFMSYESFYNGAPEFKRISNDYMSRVESDNQGNIWALLKQGMKVYQFDGDSVLTPMKQFRHYWANNKSISSDYTTEIMKDNTGIIWIGTNGSGLNKYNPKRKNFKHFSTNENLGSLSHNKIRSIYEDNNDNLWIGTEGGGINFLNSTTPKQYADGFVNYKNNNMNDVPTSIYAIGGISNSNQDFILAGGGFPKNLNSFIVNGKSLPVSVDNVSGIIGSGFYIFTDKDQQVWVASYNGGLYRFLLNERGNLIEDTVFKHDPHVKGSLSSNIVRSINQDLKGNLWIGTDKGLNKLTYDQVQSKSAQFIVYKHDQNDPYSLSFNYVLPIMVTEDNQVWVGTLGGGLNKVIQGDKPDNDQFLSYTTKDGLPNNVIKALLEGDDGSIWLSSNKGITHFSPDKLEFKNYSINDGLQDLEFSELAAYKRKDGEMIFGGVNGFNAFYPQNITRDSTQITVRLDNLQILNKEVAIGDSVNQRVLLKKNINDLEKLYLKHNENSFSVSFAALHYAAPDQNAYAYKLEGFDDNWIKTTASNRVAKYTNLSPGDYTLLVKGSNNDGFWSSEPIKLPLTILRPFWKTPWAIATYVLLVLAGLWFFRKFTLISITSKNELVLEHMEREKHEEVNQMKLKFFTNISHEFRTPLTLIIGFIERLKNHSGSLSEEERQKYYQNVGRNSKVLLNLINQLLGFRKLEQGKMKLKASYNDLTNYVQLLGENFYELANQKNITFNVNYDHVIETWFDHEILERVIFNLLSNAFKYTPAGGKIDVHLVLNGEYVDIIVEDNGEGIPESMHDQVFERFAPNMSKRKTGSGIGLSFVQSLIHLHHGEITFDRQRDTGTLFCVSLPMDKEVYTKDELVDGGNTSMEIHTETDWLIPTSNPRQIPATSEPKDKTLLLIEDNKDILYFLEENFKHEFNILMAEEGEKAYDLCINNNIDLVISDIMMDGLNGLDFCIKLKQDERVNHIPVILLTAKGDSEDKIKGYEVGADAYIAKPFNLKELETRIHAILDSRQAVIGKFKSNKSISPSEVGMTSIDEKFLNRVMVYIEENLSSSEFTVEMLARECGLSQLHLNKKLKALVGDTANSFIRNIRIQRAAQLLKRNMYSISEIMYEVGFNDAKYFRDCFKKEYQMTPSEYQKQHTEEGNEEKAPS
ncbi:hybrid sensor histidine kinase/response regulator transcription factor [Reichenbachiella agariperforans]|uniref:hybrid sensor histidine kinase/response regulator transcription factor n=1 Tax=Reichenbachiella agariperforans TaxID=156994 RepID=UPI001C0A56BB|nr:hybrid sensor histidine kinase/response regulator transcription factor [Reichenbachiella agariperforans]MBU2912589.1 response regulator [Reichenbachiella agariperforans]